MNEKRESFPAVGGSSLLVIFSVLCLTIFVLLALSTVQAGGRLSEKTTAAVIAYYEADSLAEEKLALLRAGKMPQGAEKTGENTYYYTCEISDTQLLAVEVYVSGEDYRILRWQAVSSAEWNPDERLNVWDGGADEEV